MIFSTAKTTPSLHRMPIAVPPFSTALTAYSTCGETGQPAGRSLRRTRLAGPVVQRLYLYLEIPAIWREDRVGKIVARTD